MHARSRVHVMLTCPFYLDPLTPIFYIVKPGFAGVYICLIFAFKQRSWVLVRTASINEAVLTCTQDLCFEQI